MADLFDPNPEFGEIRLGTVERLRWTNSLGLQAYADLVLPPDHKLGQCHPLIVVGYTSQGFLLGGTGGDYPIYLLAARGYAVLSVSRPPLLATLQSVKTATEIQHIDYENWADWRSVEDSLEAGIRLAEDRGVVDSDRLGLTGFSNGASTARFILLHSRKFGAAELSHFSESESGAFLNGPAAGRALKSWGKPGVTDKTAPAYWADMSMVSNADTMSTPLLLQLSDDETLGALEGFTALREQHQAVEMYIFPGEHHVKAQPAHFAAEYARDIDWFDFWLQGREDQDQGKSAQYARWRQLRVERQQNASASPGH